MENAVNAALDWNAEQAVFIEMMRPQLENSFVQFANAAYAGVKGTSATYQPIDDAANAWIDAHALELAKGITKTTKKYMRVLVKQARDEGWSSDRLAAELREVYYNYSRNRSFTVARTEAGFAANAGTIAGFKAAGITQVKWFSAMDERVCPICGEDGAHGEIVTIGQEFGIGVLMPPAHPNCRCTLLAILSTAETVGISAPAAAPETPGIKALVDARVAQGVVTDMDVIDVGRLILDETNARMEAAKQLLEPLLERRNEILAQMDDLVNTTPEQRALLLDEYEKLGQEMKVLRPKQSDMFLNVLNDVRLMGTAASAIQWQKGSRVKVKEAVAAVAKYLPAAWWAVSNISGAMAGKQVQRGYYQEGTNTIALSEGRAGGMERCALHELSHRMEFKYDRIKQFEKLFYERRTAGEQLRQIPGHGPSEKARFDDFISPYMGKDYKGWAYEILSMGMEAIFFGTYPIMNDTEYVLFILGVLACL